MARMSRAFLDLHDSVLNLLFVLEYYFSDKRWILKCMALERSGARGFKKDLTSSDSGKSFRNASTSPSRERSNIGFQLELCHMHCSIQPPRDLSFLPPPSTCSRLPPPNAFHSTSAAASESWVSFPVS